MNNTQELQRAHDQRCDDLASMSAELDAARAQLTETQAERDAARSALCDVVAHFSAASSMAERSSSSCSASVLTHMLSAGSSKHRYRVYDIARIQYYDVRAFSRSDAFRRVQNDQWGESLDPSTVTPLDLLTLAPYDWHEHVDIANQTLADDLRAVASLTDAYTRAVEHRPPPTITEESKAP